MNPVKRMKPFHVLLLLSTLFFSQAFSDFVECLNGDNQNGTCICQTGWSGARCDLCSGKKSLIDGSGKIEGKNENERSCTWVISSSTNNSVIYVSVVGFNSSDCPSPLHICDGKSVSAHPNVTITNINQKNSMTNFTAFSGTAFIYIEQSKGCSIENLSITYSVEKCPESDLGYCYVNGRCMSGACICNDGFEGPLCDVKLCPNNCSSNGICENSRCSCYDHWTGDDCSVRNSPDRNIEIVWTTTTPNDCSLFHTTTVVNDSLYVMGGHSATETFMDVYNFKEKKWQRHMNIRLKQWSHHSSVAYKHKIYVFGGQVSKGMVSNDLVEYDVLTRQWENLNDRQIFFNCSWSNKTKLPSNCNKAEGPVGSMSHSAVLIPDHNKMLIIFGYSDKYQVLDIIQEMNFKTWEWKIFKGKGYPVKGSYGHSSVHDPVTDKVFVYGGYNSEFSMSSRLYSLSVKTYEWVQLHEGPSPVAYHTALLYNGLMIVYQSRSTDPNEESRVTLTAYDLPCDSWQIKFNSTFLTSSLYEIGHSGFIHNDFLHLYGRHPVERSCNFLTFGALPCASFFGEKECTGYEGGKCIWNKLLKKCINYLSMNPSQPEKPKCKNFNIYCPSDRRTISSLRRQCREEKDKEACTQTVIGCLWTYGSEQCLHETENEINYSDELTSNLTALSTQEECSHIESCGECTRSGCFWCQSAHGCYHKNAMKPFFVNEHCTNWVQEEEKCTNCSKHRNCKDCVNVPACGWCNFGEGTGVGHCFNGGDMLHPMCNKTTWTWEFFNCSDCQCNGHSTCNKIGKCSTPCSNHTVGENCENCGLGFFGDPRNGGKCQRCACNGHAVDCNKKTGQCYCSTHGFLGIFNCTRCDEDKNFFWDENSSTCLYNMTIGNKSLFSIDEQYITHLNLKFSTEGNNDGIKLAITCSKQATVHITHSEENSGVEMAFPTKYCMNFGGHPTIFNLPDPKNESYRVYIYGFRAPIDFNIGLHRLNFTEAQKKFMVKNAESDCPCNGHSICNKMKKCIQPCSNNTMGDTCQLCKPGFYGNPEFGGSCHRCSCNNHGYFCDSTSGACFCQTKGVIGHSCDKCDETNNFIKDAEKQTCFYNLNTNRKEFSFTFDHSKWKQNQINFIYTSMEPDETTELKFRASSPGVSITVTSTDGYMETTLEDTQLKVNEWHLRMITGLDQPTAYFFYLHNITQNQTIISVNKIEYPTFLPRFYDLSMICKN